PEQLVGLGAEIGLVGGRGSTVNFFADAHMYRLFAVLAELGVDRLGIERVGELILEGQRTAAEAAEVVVAGLRSACAAQAGIAARVHTRLPRAGGAVRLILLSAVTSRLIALHGLTGTGVDGPTGRRGTTTDRRRRGAPSSVEDDRPRVVHQDPVLEMPPEPPGEYQFLRVAALAHHVLHGRRVVDPDDVLLDDRPLVQIRGHVVAGGADQL